MSGEFLHGLEVEAELEIAEACANTSSGRSSWNT